MAESDNKLTEGEAIEFLRTKFRDEGYSVIPQVGNSTGANKRRTADAVMVQMWPSRGLHFTGVEYKRTLGDWRRELKDVHKSEEIARFCRHWVILAPKGVVPVDEVPLTWGLWEIGTDLKLYRTRMPPAREDVEPATLPFFCAILRAAERHDPGREAINRARREGYEEGVKSGVDEAGRRHRELERLARKVREFEEASGINIQYGWALDKIGPAAKRYMENPDGFEQELRRVHRMAAKTQEQIDAILAGEDREHR